MNKTAEIVMYNAFLGEIAKIANKGKVNKKPPEWAKTTGKIIGFSIGAGLGVALGDAAASSISKPSTELGKNLLRIGGGALTGAAALSLVPKIQDMAKKVMSDKG